MTDHLTDEDWGRAAAYLDNELEPAERAAFERWVAEQPERAALIEQLRAEWGKRASAAPGPVWDIDAAAAEFAAARATVAVGATGTRSYSRSHSRPVVGGLTVRPPARPSWRSPWLAAVGAIGIAAAATVMILVRPPRDVPDAAVRSYVTRPGQRLRAQLADGSIIVLAPGSTLRTSLRFGTDDRTVVLDGEAYFDVAHTTAVPFIVRTTRATTRVLGTRFDVRAFETDGTVQLSVIDGRVALDDSVVVSGGESVRRDPIGAITRVATLPAADVLAWTNGELVFHDTPLLDAIPQLERWYDLTIHLADARLASRPLTATFRDTDHAADVLTVVAHTLGVTVSRRGRDVSFR